MKTLTLTTTLGFILLLPPSVIASPDEDVTIRVMQMNEDDPRQQMMNLIPLPEFANQEAREQAMQKSRERVTVREHDGAVEDLFQPGMEQARELTEEMEQETNDNNLPGGPKD